MILAIKRAERFSPNSVDKDAAILECVGRMLMRDGYDVRSVDEESAWTNGIACAYISMGRFPETLSRLADAEQNGAIVVNSAESVGLACHRHRLNDILKDGGIPIPDCEGAHGYWLKRGKGVAEHASDVRFAPDRDTMLKTKAEMKAEGMSDVIVQAHIVGDLVKFYGVRGTQFFRAFYPGDDGQTKFGDEKRNGRPQHYLFSIGNLHATAEHAAALSGLDVYGGDCIVSPDGQFSIIDFNDWPSFSRCRQEAAKAIATLVEQKLQSVEETNRKRNDAKH